MTKNRLIIGIVLLVLVVAFVLCSIFVRANDTHECHECDGDGCESCEYLGYVESESNYSETFMALVAPIIAIALALITKEVYSSLFIGVVVGAFLYGNFKFSTALDAIVGTGISSAVADNAGIFVFLVILGIMVALVNRAGGTQAFGRWAEKNIKTKVGACIATFLLGVLIFIDDYFNCLTVGSVMKPLTDSHKISRVKLAYLIDATAAPICMIAPISSWAAAVSQYAEDGKGFTLFVTAIPFNFYSLLTLVFIVTMSIMGFDYGKMSEFEIRAQKTGDLGSIEADDTPVDSNGASVWDLFLPIIVLIVACVVGLIYVGGFFDAESSNYLNFISAFGDTDAFVGLPWGGFIALIFTIVYLMVRGRISFKESMESVPKGFLAMVPAILILTLATALKNMTVALGAKYFVKALMANAGALTRFLPAIIFLVACGLSFATGTSWGTFGILIPIVLPIFADGDPLQIVGISACLAGAVCGDHCSPISDTTIMASAGAQCNHVDHVATQLPYAITVAAVSFVSFIIAGLVPIVWIALPVAIVLMIGTIFGIRFVTNKNAQGKVEN